VDRAHDANNVWTTAPPTTRYVSSIIINLGKVIGHLGVHKSGLAKGTWKNWLLNMYIGVVGGE
jgi:hypothetical protein